MTKMTEDDFDESELFSPTAVPVSRARVASPVAPIPVEIAENDNPLSKFFRLPGLSISLPTKGAFFPEGGIVLDEAGEVSVLPMRAADELLLSSPDALMNNTAITNLIRSCIPQIKMPEMVSAPDLDAILIAIRVASSGEEMEIDLTCPECKKETTFEVNLPAVLGTVQTIPAVIPLRLGDNVVVYLRPHTVAVQTKILISAFKETRAAQAIDANEELTDEQRSEKLAAVMEKLNEMNLYGLAHSIIKVVIPGHEVVNTQHIMEFLANTDKGTLMKVRNELERINSMGVDKSVPAVCQFCAHEWMGQLEFNPSTFFEQRSSD